MPVLQKSEKLAVLRKLRDRGGRMRVRIHAAPGSPALSSHEYQTKAILDSLEWAGLVRADGVGGGYELYKLLPDGQEAAATRKLPALKADAVATGSGLSWQERGLRG